MKDYDVPDWKSTKYELPSSDIDYKLFFTDEFNNVYFGSYFEHYEGNSEFVIETVICKGEIHTPIREVDSSLWMNDRHQECKWWADCRIFP